MDPIDSMLDFDTSYMCGPQDYIDTSSSESTSPAMTSYEMPIMSSIPNMANLPCNIYPSPTNSARETASPQPAIKEEEKAASTEEAKPVKAPAKRKRENRYKNAPPSVLSRRRAQNRASQRAYRERKDQRIKDLEVMLEESKQKHEALAEAYSALHAEYMKFRSVHSRNAAAAQAAAVHHHQQQQQRHASINIPFDLSPTLSSVGSTPVSGMSLMDGWGLFSEPMPSYGI